MRSLVFATVAVVLMMLSVAMGRISTMHHEAFKATNQGLLGGFQAGTMGEWFCANKGGDSNCGETMSFSEMRSEFLLRIIQTLHAFGNAGSLPSAIAAPLSHMKGTPRPQTLEDARTLLEPIHKLHGEDTKYAYFGFLPLVDATLYPDGANVTYSTPCFSQVTVLAKTMSPTLVRVHMTTQGHKLLCEDDVITWGGGVTLKSVSEDGSTNFDLDLSKIAGNEAEMWLVKNRGILVGRFEGSDAGVPVGGFATATGNLLSTVALLAGFAEAPISKMAFDAATQFFQNYVQFNASRMGEKVSIRTADETPGHFVAKDINASEINSGDAFVIIRPDGLNSMIAWAEGASPGHMTVALRSPTNGTLYVCESQSSGAYWPKNGIQCHPWTEWWPMAHAAQFNIVLLPMKPSVRASFDLQKAWDFFYEHEGLNYGYLVLLAGWLDMKEGDQNSPCLPPDFKKCLSRPLIERVLVLIDGFMGNGTENIIRQNFAHRVGRWPEGVSAAESIMIGQKTMGLNTISDLYSIVEQDDWDYNTTRYGKPHTGKSQVCNVFVCNILKHGGAFGSTGSEIQCGESTSRTVFAADIWDSAKMGDGRPDICKTADPANMLCQLMGNWTFHIHPDLNSVPVHANMSNHCPSEAPNYYNPENC